ncbi:MAG: class F sortase [bacterium]|nr:class F sortase [bacterium]
MISIEKSKLNTLLAGSVLMGVLWLVFASLSLVPHVSVFQQEREAAVVPARDVPSQTPDGTPPSPEYPPLFAAIPAVRQMQTSKPAVVASKTPVRLKIPALSINARVEDVGIAKSGAIASPGSFSTVGWYKYGAKPGEKGSVIMDGHVDNGLAKVGVFKRLENIKEGDRIFVETADGKTFEYVVERMVTYPYKSVPMANIVNQKSQAELVLITCAGEFMKDLKTYTERLIVHAVLVERV